MPGQAKDGVEHNDIYINKFDLQFMNIMSIFPVTFNYKIIKMFIQLLKV